MVFSALLFCVSSVCAQDINATDNIADLNNNDNNINNNINNNIDIVKNHIIDEENETLENQNADNLTAEIVKNHIIDEENESLENQNADNLTAEGTFDDFQSEINKASEGSVLNLTRDYTGAHDSKIQFNKDLTIDGQGHTIGFGFYSSCGKITLMNLKIINDYKDKNYNGGAILIGDSAQYTIINCTFNNNWAKHNGGAIFNGGNKLTIINCSFNNNEADVIDGGAIYSKGNVYIKNSIFNSNHANEDGGAIFCCNDANITNCLFKSNKANGAKAYQCEGGAICCKGDLTIENSTFEDNYAEDYGGAIYANTLTLNPNCIFDSNIAYDNQGGAIWVNKFNKDVISTTFIKNKAGEGAKDDGGAIYINNENHITFSNCTFKSNWAGDEGGAIYLDSPSSDLTLKNNTIIDNHADDEGQVVFNKGTYATIKNNYWETDSPDFSKDFLVEWKRWTSNIKHKDESPLKYFSIIGTFDDLQAEINNASENSVLYLTRDYNVGCGSRIQINKNLTINGQGHTIDCLNRKYSVFYSNCGNITLINITINKGCDDKGGAIHIDGSAQYTIENCTFFNNFASDYGGAIYNEGNNILTIKNSKFSSNSANNIDGGAIFSTKDIIIKDSIFDLNVADENGGAISCGANIYVENSIFYSNNVKSREWSWYEYIYHWADNPQCCGGAIFAKGNVDIKNSTFTSNFASDYGGAIYANNINISENSTFFKNSVEDNDGGAIYADNTATLSDVFFIENNAKVDGGAVYTKGKTCCNKCLFKNNQAQGAKSAQCYGGAICSKSDVWINNTTFIKNIAADYGGAIYANSIYINQKNNNTQSFFINNSANNDKGGAIFAESNLEATNTLFSGNCANVDGGAVYAKYNVVVRYCLLENNKAQGAKSSKCYGGAIRAEEELTILNSTFKNNYTENNGGAVYADSIILEGLNLFENNIAKIDGGAIYTDKFGVDPCNAAFINNTAQNGDGGAIYINKKANITISQCCFINNQCGDEGGAIYLDSSNLYLTLLNNFFESNSASDGYSVYNCGLYDNIMSNFWINATPNSSNNQLVKWGAITPNTHYEDKSPMKLDLLIDMYEKDDDIFLNVKVVYVNSDNTLFTDVFNMVNVTYEVIACNKTIKTTNTKSDKNYRSFDFIPSYGNDNITIKYKDYTISKTVNIEYEN
ncbi:right-handed parallel beta-helix repeat-containing protein [uncultured Methanobrevibacter sp.]|uniref:right-handed parallel beta-helix repeat-containing protein n=1 Tax=uncultured Methanobrevibacter sp. TaxID=253161 RepID=UPI0025E88C96|nr:right-handed parallel beta-helix repeat-containing protein [uncultured Methanobrevibacter sp.]